MRSALGLLFALACASAASAQPTQSVTGTSALGALRFREVSIRVTTAANAGDDVIADANASLASASIEAFEACLVTGENGPWDFVVRLRRDGTVRRVSFVPADPQGAVPTSTECIRAALTRLTFASALGRRVRVEVRRNSVGAGFGGLGLRGTGRGGGGTVEGTIGLGNLGTIGGGSMGSPRPRIRTGSAMVSGSLDRNIIRRVIRRHLAEVRACYERALARSPGLEGTVAVRFEIAGDGHVSSAESIRVPDGFEEVGACIKQRVLGWVFPAPAGGGIVRVTYPFAFRPG